MPAEHSIPEDSSRRKIIIVVAVIAAVFIGGFFYLLLRKTVGVSQSPKLENAIRPGSADWDKYQKLIALDDPEADEAKRARNPQARSEGARVARPLPVDGVRRRGDLRHVDPQLDREDLVAQGGRVYADVTRTQAILRVELPTRC